jgi:hypothetical protein
VVGSRRSAPVKAVTDAWENNPIREVAAPLGACCSFDIHKGTYSQAEPELYTFFVTDEADPAEQNKRLTEIAADMDHVVDAYKLALACTRRVIQLPRWAQRLLDSKEKKDLLMPVQKEMKTENYFRYRSPGKRRRPVDIKILQLPHYHDLAKAEKPEMRRLRELAAKIIDEQFQMASGDEPHMGMSATDFRPPCWQRVKSSCPKRILQICKNMPTTIKSGASG